jgi:hypothetical protein
MERVLLKEDNYLEGKIASSTSSLPAVNAILRRASRKRPWKPEVPDNYCSRSVLFSIPESVSTTTAPTRGVRGKRKAVCQNASNNLQFRAAEERSSAESMLTAARQQDGKRDGACIDGMHVPERFTVYLILRENYINDVGKAKVEIRRLLPTFCFSVFHMATPSGSTIRPRSFLAWV